MSNITQNVANSYIEMANTQNQTTNTRPKWVPASITEENLTAFVQVVKETRKADKAAFEFNGKEYSINESSCMKKPVKEELKDDEGDAKKAQDDSAKNALKQDREEAPKEVKEEDSEEIKMDNHDEKEADADEMPKLDDIKTEELVGNQHKLDMNKDGEIDAEDLKKLRRDESTQLTGEQTIASVAATYALMVNENVAGDPHAANLSAKANSLTALAHTSNSETHHKDAQHAHYLAAEHYRVYAHNHHDPMVRGAANIHHEFHMSMHNHHMLHLVGSDMDREAHDMAAKHYGKKSVKEGSAADAEAGPEVMDPVTKKMKDDHDDETEITDGVPSAAQDGSDKVSPADKPAATNKSAPMPKVKTD